MQQKAISNETNGPVQLGNFQYEPRIDTDIPRPHLQLSCFQSTFPAATPQTSARQRSGATISPVAPRPRIETIAAKLDPACQRQQEIVAWIAIAAIWILSAFAFYLIWAKADGGI